MPTNSLHDYLSQQGAQFGDVAGEQVAQNYGDTNAEYRALIESVALVDLSFRGCLAVLGDDRVKFINGQVTNEVAGLKSGQGCYAALVNAKAKMQADLHVYRLDDELILDFEPGLLDAVTERLESHVVADQVELIDASPHFGLLSLQGPKTADALASLGLALPGEPFAHAKSPLDGLGEVYVMNNGRYGTAGCDLYIPTGHLGEAAERLAKAVEGQGGRLAGWQATEIARVEAGIPRFGIDMDNKTSAARGRTSRPEPSATPRAATSGRKSSHESAPTVASTEPSLVTAWMPTWPPELNSPTTPARRLAR